MEQFANNAATLLNGGIDDTTTTITVDSTTGFPSSGVFRIKIDDEILIVQSVDSSTQFTASRGDEGTTAASHSDNADVIHVLTAGAVNAILNGTSHTMNGVYSQILAGSNNSITYNEFNGYNGIIAGSGNTIDTAGNSVIIGGTSNEILDGGSADSEASVIVGGSENLIEPAQNIDSQWCVIVGGQYNTARGNRNVILGGNSNTAHLPAVDCTIMGTMGEAGFASDGSGYATYNAMIHGHNMNGFQGEAQFERHLESAKPTTGSPERAYTYGGSASIPLPPNHWATGFVIATGVGENGQSFHIIQGFGAGNAGFGAAIFGTTSVLAHNEGGVGPSITISADGDYIYASGSATNDYDVEWLISFEQVRLYRATTGATS